MMLPSIYPPSVIRSSMEEMLDSLRRKDELQKPNDVPPPLPPRPKARGRLPSTRGRFHVNPNMLDGVVDLLTTNLGLKVGERKSGIAASSSENEGLGIQFGSFGRGKRRREYPVESPYALLPGDRSVNPRFGNIDDGACLACTSCPSDVESQESQRHNNISYFIQNKLSVWYRLDNGEWVSAKIQSTSGDEACILLSNGSVIKSLAAEIMPANPDIVTGVVDLMQLVYLNEPSILHNLQERYAQDKIYCKAGPLLISLNPYKGMQDQGDCRADSYRQNKKLSDTPHVYAVADASYNRMMNDGTAQSIIISGESGAGKTETAKLVIQYFACLGGSGNLLERQILHTNCILEAFGNSKTSINNNSTRFGKLVRIHFSSSGKIRCAKIQTFLLDKSRVVHLENGERSYHIFYQLCAGASSSLKDELRIENPIKYKYLNQSNCLEIDGLSDSHQFQNLLEALEVVRIQKSDRESIFRTISAVLWLGNVCFVSKDGEDVAEVVEDEAVSNSALLMGCSRNQLMQVLNGTTTERMTVRQAVRSRDLLAMFIYSKLFDWIVERLNASLSVEEEEGGSYDRSITISDVYGFQSFENNSFEQLCINYASERLQQHFIRHLFKLQQQDYDAEGIEWRGGEFEDNEDVLDLIEKKPLGLFHLVDEESRFPHASDSAFAEKLGQHLNNNPTATTDGTGSLTISHHAGKVRYDTAGFLEKNRDELHEHLIDLFSASDTELLRTFSSSASPGTTASIRCKDEVFELIRKLEGTTPHFICCVKPNGVQSAGVFDPRLVLRQLRCSGIPQSIRMSRSVYPTRLTHREFSSRYGCLLGLHDGTDPLSTSAAVLKRFRLPPGAFEFGFTKLYFSSGQIDSMEEHRRRVIAGVVAIQSRYRRHRSRRATVPAPPAVADDLWSRLRKKEEECDALRDRLNQLETARSDHDAKLNAEIASLKKRLAGDDVAPSPPPRCCGLDDGGARSRRPAVRVDVDRLAKEFDQRRRTFDGEADALLDSGGGGPDAELRRLKKSFEAWKNDFRVRLGEAKVMLHKQWRHHHHHSQGRWQWWGRTGGTKAS